MKNNIELSERLRQLRKSAGLSQEQLAETLDISRQAVSKWESGDTVREMADTTFQEEEKPSAREKFPANSFLWAALGTVIVLILYLLTNLF